MVPGQDQVTIRKSIGIRGYSRDQVWSFLCCVSTFTQFVQKAQKEQGTPECTGSRQPLRVRRPYCSIALSGACLHFCQSKWGRTWFSNCRLQEQSMDWSCMLLAVGNACWGDLLWKTFSPLARSSQIWVSYPKLGTPSARNSVLEIRWHLVINLLWRQLKRLRRSTRYITLVWEDCNPGLLDILWYR